MDYREDSPLLINLVSETPVVESKPKASTVSAYFTFVAGFIGGGLLGLPYGFFNGGLIACAIGLIVLAIISNYTIRLLGYCKMDYRKEKINSYADIGRVSFGTVGTVLVNTSVIISQLGYCCAYVVYIADNLHALSFMPKSVTVLDISLAILPVVTLFCYLRSMKYLSPTAILANVAVIVVVVTVISYGAKNAGIDKISDYPYVKLGNFPIFYGIVAFGYTIHGLALDIQSSMQIPQRFNLVVDLSMSFVTTIYLVFGGLGYLFFKEATSCVITNNLEQGLMNDVIKLALSTVLIFAYPLQMFPVITILERLIFTKERTPIMDTLLRNLLRTFLTVITVALALGIPFFGKFSAFVGTFSNSFIAFIFPPIAYLKLFNNPESPRFVPTHQKVICVIIAIIGVLGLGVGSSVVAKDIVQALVSHEKGAC